MLRRRASRKGAELAENAPLWTERIGRRALCRRRAGRKGAEMAENAPLWIAGDGRRWLWRAGRWVIIANEMRGYCGWSCKL